jgi:uncharacterized coiled-coil DUF342 family protein
MKTIEELEARLETVNVERDDLKQRLLDMVLQRNDVRDKLDICGLDLVTAKRERDEARDEVKRFRDWYRNAFGGPSKRETPWDPCACDECESLRRLKDERPVHPSNLTDVVSLLEDERDELLVRVANQEAELRATREAYREARTEVLQLKGKLHIKRIRIRLQLIDEVRSDAYRRGAEAMREACARVADAHCVPGTRDVIRALPIPEEP